MGINFYRVGLQNRLKYRTVIAEKAGNGQCLLALAPAVQKVDSAIPWIHLYPVASQIHIHWIVIYLIIRWKALSMPAFEQPGPDFFYFFLFCFILFCFFFFLD